MRQFKDLGGEDPIVIHRLLKNSVKSHEYMLMTEPFWRASGGLADEKPTWLTENCEGIGPVRVAVVHAESAPAPVQRHTPMTRPRAVYEMMRLTMSRLFRRMTQRGAYSHLPA